MAERRVMGVKLTDAGATQKEMGYGASLPVKEQKNKKDYPGFSLRNDQIPENLYKKDVGDKCVMVAIVRMKSKEEEKREKRDGNCTVGMEIEHFAFTPMKGKKAADMTDEEIKEGIKDGTGSDEE